VDGYLLKPVEPEEVHQAVQEALNRRKRLVRSVEAGQEEHVLQQGPFCVGLDKHTATRDGQPLELTPQEFKLLVTLMQNAHRVISPRELVRVVREYESEDVYEARQIIKWYIHRLRRKVEPDPSNPRYILSVRGVGYRFEG
jgi:two-component system response regulator RegX3